MIPVDTVEVQLNSGEIATIEMSEQFLKMIRGVFNLSEDVKPSPQQVKMFLAQTIKNAVEKEESEKQNQDFSSNESIFFLENNS